MAFLRWLLSALSGCLDALIPTGCCFQEQTLPVCPVYGISAYWRTQAGGRIEGGAMELDGWRKNWCSALGVTWGG